MMSLDLKNLGYFNEEVYGNNGESIGVLYKDFGYGF